MSNRLTKILIIVFSVLFAVRVLTIFTADRLYSMSLAAKTGEISPDQGIKLLTIAERLDSTNANLYFTEYELLGIRIGEEKAQGKSDVNEYNKRQLQLLKTAIDLSPSWPAYHMYYAMTLRRMSPRANILTAVCILSQFKMSVDLKPFSDTYSKIYKRYHEKFIKKYGPVSV